MNISITQAFTPQYNPQPNSRMFFGQNQRNFYFAKEYGFFMFDAVVFGLDLFFQKVVFPHNLPGGIMASVSDFRNGMAMRHNGEIWIVNEFQHVKPGKGHAFIRTKLKQLKSGKVVEYTFRQHDTIEELRLENREMQYLYDAGDDICVMDPKTYEQINVHKTLLGDQIKFLKEGNSTTVLFMEGKIVQASLPNFIELTVTEASPGVKGDTVSNLQKPVTVETGAEIQAPLFIKEGDLIKVDTRDGKYVERVNS